MTEPCTDYIMVLLTPRFRPMFDGICLNTDSDFVLWADVPVRDWADSIMLNIKAPVHGP